MTPDPRLPKILGALIGVHAGDSLGATLEFQPWARIHARYPHGLRDIIGGGPFQWPAGHATDDTDLTRAVLLAYRNRASSRSGNAPQAGTASAGSFDVVKAAADWSVKWLTGDWPGRRVGSSPVDIGGATREGLSRYLQCGDPRGCGAGEGSAGNGSLMRCVPTALFVGGREQRVKESMEISAFTHDDARCTVSCAAYNEIVVALVEGVGPREAIGKGVECARELGGVAVVEAIERGKGLSIEELAEKGPGRELPDRTSGYVLQSLSVAVAALLDERSLEDVLVDVVRIGGDTDTNGAISGGLLGARDGIAAIPERWQRVLQFREEFESLAMEILNAQG
ncbi:ADP-ribosylglycohydrolase family protein [Corynespora cassiicola Philippines]|uniref:ADP-ribosylhydrolase ARH3 n=1 Tax=Corynespora cassiicola Philippines TaxID=1448308 RepID=A0A2T2NY85_CORCC|nr:ADP-ribosylglycohydrolase family protein [Corynespora cassiicola Philippines]